MSLRGKKGTQIACLCIRHLQAHKRLFLFPLIGSVCKFILFICVIWPFVFHREYILHTHGSSFAGIASLVLIFMLLLFMIHLLLYFFNAAVSVNLLYFVHHKQESSIRFGIVEALVRYPRIFLWVSYAGTIGLCLNMISSKNQSKWLKNIRSLLQHNQWRIATYLSLITVIDKEANPHNALKQSAELMHTTWGENLRPTFSFSAKFLLARVLGLIPLILGIIYAGSDHRIIMITGGISVLIWILISSLSQMLNSCLQVAMYAYAQQKIITPPFTQELLAHIFKTRSF